MKRVEIVVVIEFHNDVSFVGRKRIDMNRIYGFFSFVSIEYIYKQISVGAAAFQYQTEEKLLHK